MWKPSPALEMILIISTVALFGCIEGKPTPRETTMVEVTDDLVFLFGDEKICHNESVAPQNRFDCDNLQDGVIISKVYPAIMVSLEPFAIDAHEVTNLQYRYCVAMGGCRPPEFSNTQQITDYYNNSRYDDFPVVNVTFEAAREYCEFVGKRLPTEYEWERVAAGGARAPGAKRIYPFEADPYSVSACVGEDAAIFYCNQDRNPRPVASSDYDRVAVGDGYVFDLGGNVREWVLDRWQEGVTCEHDLADCRDCFACDLNLDSRCLIECRLCPECDANPEICFRQCAGRSTEKPEVVSGFPICLKYDGHRSCGVSDDGESTCAPSTSPHRAVRGGSYLTGETQTCLLRATDRSQRRVADEINNDLGFRCARSLEL